MSLFLSSQVHAIDMLVSNPSFDYAQLANGRNTRTVLNWSVTGNTNNSDVGVYNPRNEYNSGVSGDNVLYMVTNTRGQRNNVVQRTNTNMKPGVTYTLKVNVGHRLRGSRRNFSGYQVSLLCGNRVVRSTSNLRAPSGRGTFGEVTVSYEAKAGDTGFVGIQFGSGTNAGPGAAVDFDHVRLSTDEVAQSREITWSGRNVTRANHRHVQDPSFERTSLNNGRAYKTFWNWNVRGNTNNSDIAIYNPTNEYSRGVSGNNILYMVSNTPGRRHNLVQHVTTRMSPGKTYRLTVDVGQRAAGSRPNFAGYQISLLSGNRVVRQVGNLAPPSSTPGTFGTVVLEYVARAGDTGAVGIQIGSGTNAGPGAAVDFDNVTLSIDGRSFGGSPSAVAQQGAYNGTSNVALRTTGSNALNVNLTDRQVVQRSLRNAYTEVPFEGKCHASARKIQILVTNRANNTRSGWVDIAIPKDGKYAGTYQLQPGWYQVRLRALNARNRQIRAIAVNHLGVGDVFICAGQSNSANFGQTRHTANFDSVSWCNVTNGTWSHATDMPGNPSASPAAAGRGSYWPILGDYIAQNKRIPSAFAVVGDGGSAVRSWNPNIQPLDNYPNLHTAISLVNPTGFRAILWHQGEAEIGRRTPNANYISDLKAVIDQTRIDAGWEIPWYVSRVHMVTAQNEVISSDRNVFAGPATDSLTMAGGMRYDRVHFSSRALPVVADMWFRSVYGNAPSGRGNGALARIGGSNTFDGATNRGGEPVGRGGAFEITTTSLAQAKHGEFYLAFVDTDNQHGDVTWQIGTSASTLQRVPNAGSTGVPLINQLRATKEDGGAGRLVIKGIPEATRRQIRNGVEVADQMYTIVATDGHGTTDTINLRLRVDLSPALVGETLAIISEDVVEMQAGVFTAEEVSVVNYADDVTWEIKYASNPNFRTLPADGTQVGLAKTFKANKLTQSKGVRISGTESYDPALGVVSVKFDLRVTDSSGAQDEKQIEFLVDYSTPPPITFNTNQLDMVMAQESYSFDIQASGGSGNFSWQVYFDGAEVNQNASTSDYPLTNGLKCKPKNRSNITVTGTYQRTEEEMRSYKSGDFTHELKLIATDEVGTTQEKTYDLTVRYPDIYGNQTVGIGYLWNRATRNESGSNSNVVSEIYQGYSKTQEIFERAGVTPNIKVFGYTTDYGAGTGTPAATIFDDISNILSGEEGEDVEFRRLTYNGSGVIGHGYYSGPEIRSTFGCNMSQFVFDRNASRGMGSEPLGLAGRGNLWLASSIVDYEHIDENVAAHEFAHNFGCVHEERWKISNQRFSVMRPSWHKTFVKNFLSDKNWYTSDFGWMGDDNQSNVDHVRWNKYIMSTNQD